MTPAVSRSPASWPSGGASGRRKGRAGEAPPPARGPSLVVLGGTHLPLPPCVCERPACAPRSSAGGARPKTCPVQWVGAVRNARGRRNSLRASRAWRSEARGRAIEWRAPGTQSCTPADDWCGVRARNVGPALRRRRTAARLCGPVGGRDVGAEALLRESGIDGRTGVITWRNSLGSRGARVLPARPRGWPRRVPGRRPAAPLPSPSVFVCAILRPCPPLAGGRRAPREPPRPRQPSRQARRPAGPPSRATIERGCGWPRRTDSHAPGSRVEPPPATPRPSAAAPGRRERLLRRRAEGRAWSRARHTRGEWPGGAVPERW